MTKMLASVNSLAEALEVLAAQVDIIDLKEPAQGALGALSTVLVKQIVDEIQGSCPISATVGDLPMQPELVSNAVIAMAATGVDYVKIGFFPGGDWQATIRSLSALTPSLALIAVLFADTQPNFNFLSALKEAGFAGVMLDTMDKQQGSLPQLLEKVAIATFVSLAKQHDLLCGLAGSLRLQDIPELLPYQADYLGFRGALCRQHNRIAQLDRQAIQRIQLAVKNDDQHL